MEMILSIDGTCGEMAQMYIIGSLSQMCGAKTSSIVPLDKPVEFS
jgi:hypothetical protein